MELIPTNFKTPEQALKFYSVPRKRKCLKCKGKKEKDSGNVFWCKKCLKGKTVYKK